MDGCWTRRNREWDTTSAFAAALAAFHRQIPVGHVEAGLRTGDMRNPFPEEANRKLITAIATWHYAPTELARANLLREGVARERILVTGNTVVDALHFVMKHTRPLRLAALSDLDTRARRMVLITCHRRESHGEPLQRVCVAIRRLAKRHPDVDWVIPLHPNPQVGQAIRCALHDLRTVRLVPPLAYPLFVWLLNQCCFVMSDSGGVQEEAPALGKPVIVLRETTERAEAVECGAAVLTGTAIEPIVAAADRLLTSCRVYRRMARTRKIFGDGHASERIAKHLQACSSALPG